MTQTDPLLEAAGVVFEVAVNDMHRAIADASAAHLNWRPAPETNSLAVLATHTMHSTRSWFAVATGAPLPERDRPSEFLVSAPDAVQLGEFVERMAAECRELLATTGVDWSARRRTHARPQPGDDPDVTAAWALLHALEHLREHVGQMQLTRQLRDAG